ncbi:MAG: hypothetical protein JWP12_2436 [Bacteroidetes bacterium]|nr:hypothetical protein [Bacteroidota bacterium]
MEGCCLKLFNNTIIHINFDKVTFFQKKIKNIFGHVFLTAPEPSHKKGISFIGTHLIAFLFFSFHPLACILALQVLVIILYRFFIFHFGPALLFPFFLCGLALHARCCRCFVFRCRFLLRMHRQWQKADE